MKRKVALSLYGLLLVFGNNILAQDPPTTGDCIGAIQVCQDYYFQPNTANGPGTYPNEILGQQACPHNCLWGERNSTWYRFTVQQGGMLRFIISPVDQTDDYDWAVYNLTYHDCEDIYDNAPEMVVSCNSVGSQNNSQWWGDTGATEDGLDECSGPGENGSKWNIEIPVTKGETYVLYVSDWSQTPPGYSLDFSASTAQIYDNVKPELKSVVSSQIQCNDSTFKFSFSEEVACETVTPDAFKLINPNGDEMTITYITGENCELGAEYERSYTATVDPLFTIGGDYQFMLKPFTGVSDACGNFALPDTVFFSATLQGPALDTSDYTATPSSCGQANGSITGIEADGNEPLTYIWINAAGDTVGYDLDLFDIPSGVYTLIVSDVNGCQSTTNDIQIADEGAPELNTSNMNIEPATCSLDNGNITGLEITGSDPFTFTWEDENNLVVGNSLNITGLPGGEYTLTVLDVNDCQAIFGPFDVESFPAPLIFDENVFITGENCNIENGSIEDILANGSGILQYRWYNEAGDTVSSDPLLTNASAATYYLLVRDVNGCETIGGPYTIPPISGPEVNETYLEVLPEGCYQGNGAILGIEVTGNSGLTYEWKDQDGITIGSDTCILENLSSGTYTLYITDAAGCETIAGPYEITNEGEPITVTASASTPVCSGDSLNLYVDFQGGEYEWTGPTGFTSNIQNPVIYPAETDNTGVYDVTVTSPFNCMDNTSVEVEVLESAEVSLEISASANPIFPGEEITFIAEAVNPGFNPIYEWVINGNVVYSGSSNTYTTSNITGDATVICRLYTEESCFIPEPAESNSLTIKVRSVEIYLPNSFYPNSTHGNNEFKVISISSSIADYQMNIYNRWGENIFSTSDPTEGWDGTYKGKEAPAGVYVYVIDYTVFDSDTGDGNAAHKSGTVTLLR